MIFPYKRQKWSHLVVDSGLDRHTYRNPQILSHLYWGLGLSTIAIGRRFDVDCSNIWRWMEKHKIPRRPTKTKKYYFSHRLLNELYWGKKLSINKIAKKLHVSSSTIRNLMIRYKILHRTISEANIKYLREDFSGDKVEKAYFLGLRTGDINVDKCCKQVRARVSSTHPAQIQMVWKTFGKYGHVAKYPAKCIDYGWGVNCYLNNSFSFLVRKPKIIPKWIMKEEKLVYAFLAGYADSEGNWLIVKNGKCITFRFRVASTDKFILKQLYEYFSNKKFHPFLRLSQKKGIKTSVGILNKDIFTLDFSRRAEVVRLAELLLPLSHHEEKTNWMRLVFKLKNIRYWTEVESRVLKLRKEIKKKVIRFSRRAELSWIRKHRVDGNYV